LEELRSTEILDREIHEDARRKVEKYLQDADNQCKKIQDEIDARLEKETEAKKEMYDKKYERFLHDIQSVVPLEKQRFLIQFQKDSVDEAIKNYFEKLSEEKKLDIIKRRLNKYKEIFSENQHEKYKFSVCVSNFSEDKGKKLFEEVFGKNCLEKIEMKKKNTDADSFGMTCVSADSSIKFEANLKLIIEELEDKYSEELASKLFCGGLIVNE